MHAGGRLCRLLGLLPQMMGQAAAERMDGNPAHRFPALVRCQMFRRRPI